MQIQAKLDGGDWQLPLNRQETEAVLENIAAVVKPCEALGIEAVLIGPRFVIRVSDIEVGRWIMRSQAWSGPLSIRLGGGVPDDPGRGRHPILLQRAWG